MPVSQHSEGGGMQQFALPILPVLAKDRHTPISAHASARVGTGKGSLALVESSQVKQVPLGATLPQL